MAYKILRNWLRGIISDNDSLDMPEDSLSECRNFIIKPGMLEQRPLAKQRITSGLTALGEFNEFTVFKGTGNGSDRFILLRDGTGLERYDLSGSPVSYNAVSIGTNGYDVAASAIFTGYSGPFGSIAPKPIRFYSINGNIRICRGGYRDWAYSAFHTLWYGYISRSFFNAAHTLTGWYLDEAKLVPVPGANHAENKVLITSSGTGDLTGRYFLRCTYEYDGYQESFHKDYDTINGEYADYVDPSNDADIEIAINDTLATYAQSLRYSTMNKRITAINVYLAWSNDTSDDQPRTAFYKAARIGMDDTNWAIDFTLDTTLLTDEEINITDDPVTFEVNATIGTKIYAGETIQIQDVGDADTENMVITSASGTTVVAVRGTKKTLTTASPIFLGRQMIHLKVKLTGNGSSSDFPANHEAYNTDDVNYNLEEEYHLSQNTLPGISEGFDMTTYSHGVWVNGRHFIFRGLTDFTRIRKSYSLGGGVDKQVDPSYDTRQTVPFSKLNKPDAFDFMIDFIDLSTDEGDPVITGAEISGDLVILKEHNMFVVSLNNTGNSLAWSINQHFQKVGSISVNGTAKGNGMLFFPGEKNIFLYDGQTALPITHGRIREAYETALASVSDKEDIWSVFDPLRNRFMMYIPGGDEYVWIYDLGTKGWTKYDYADGANKYDIKSLMIGNDLEVFAGNDDGDALLELETTGGAESATQAKTMTTQWLSLSDNPHEEKRLMFIRIDMNMASGTYHLSLYGNVNSTSAVWTASSQTAQADRKIHYHEVSEVARQFKLQIQAVTGTAKIYGVEFNYLKEGDEQ